MMMIFELMVWCLWDGTDMLAGFLWYQSKNVTVPHIPSILPTLHPPELDGGEGIPGEVGEETEEAAQSGPQKAPVIIVNGHGRR